MLPRLVQALRDLPAFRGLASALPPRGTEVTIGGLPGSSAAVLVAGLTEALPQRIVVVVVAGPADAERWFADLGVLVGNAARLYPQRESLGAEEPHVEIAGERVETLDALLSGRARLLVTTVRASMERTRMRVPIARARVTVRKGDRVPPHEVVQRLEAAGYERRPSVTDVGQLALRGGIVDVYGFGMAAPARVEWWGDEILSIRSFDLDSQRSEREVETVTALPLRPPVEPATLADDAETLLDLLPPDTLFVSEPGAGAPEVERAWAEASHHVEVARRRGEDVVGREAVLLAPPAWAARWNGFARLGLVAAGATHDFKVQSPEPVNRDIRRLARLARVTATLILCDNEGQLERLDELLEGSEGGTPAGVTLALGALSGGFVLPGLQVFTDHEIFRRARRVRRARRYRQALGPAAGASLKAGDIVVHVEHGIGVYRGMATIAVGEGAMEVAVVEYEGGDRLSVPLYRIDQLEPFRTDQDAGMPLKPPRLDKLGGTRWRKRRDSAQRSIRQMAAELLDLHARRATAVRNAYLPDTRWQRELESAFLYEDTPDQRLATEAVKRDLERGQPMDRLIVGDVGYGKTEVAVRAAFKVAQAGKQVAVLVPTTILAEQHGRTFGERLADFPVRIAVLSRFRTTAEQQTVLAGLKDGTVDIVIGTHRLLSADVKFHDLGLLVVDEEHRFGVRHKERLKALRLEVDILTLTATPIPRTLHLALSGLRDLTLIETPPRDRSPVLTFVEPWDDGLLEEAIAREMDRGGQVFFVHNRIETIGTLAARVAALAPRARVAVAHGQMPERQLDEVMRRFVAGEVDVLVSTMIVESGLDVANANTMIVHQADHLGLAQLYQLRGRVGRGHRRAYCYLIVPDDADPAAEQRLQVLEHHTELGAGYRIALRDLELRGAGNLLGAEQSGHAHAVGFDLYLRWLDDAVRGLKGEGRAPSAPPEVIFDGPAYFTDAYVPDEDAKLDLYRRLARATEPCEIQALRDELQDRFGPVPPEADRVLAVSELRALGASLGLETVLVRGDEARLSFRAGAAPRLAGLTAALDDVQFAVDVRRAVPLSLRLTRLGGLAMAPGLVRALSAAVNEDPATSRRVGLVPSKE
jgi:transcription-repair coupling factor (superfamily II helicase)